jgi:hypothetical protein
LQRQVPDGRIQFGQVQVTDPGVAERGQDVDVQAGPLFGQRRLRASSPVPLDPVGHQILRRHVSEPHTFGLEPSGSTLGLVEVR